MPDTRWSAKRGRCVPDGQLGKIRKIAVEYLQGWLTKPIEMTGQKQATWRSDPAQSGLGGCIGDIGVHAFHLAEYVTGLKVVGLNASLLSVVPGRKLDDDCTALLRMDNDAQSILMTSQIAAGEGNGLRLRVYGEKDRSIGGRSTQTGCG